MKLLLALICMIALAFASPAFAYTTSAKLFPAKCGAEAPADAPQKRPGGFCAAVDNLKSLVGGKAPPTP